MISKSESLPMRIPTWGSIKCYPSYRSVVGATLVVAQKRGRHGATSLHLSYATRHFFKTRPARTFDQQELGAVKAEHHLPHQSGGGFRSSKSADWYANPPGCRCDQARVFAY